MHLRWAVSLCPVSNCWACALSQCWMNKGLLSIFCWVLHDEILVEFIQERMRVFLSRASHHLYKVFENKIFDEGFKKKTSMLSKSKKLIVFNKKPGYSRVSSKFLPVYGQYKAEFDIIAVNNNSKILRKFMNLWHFCQNISVMPLLITFFLNITFFTTTYFETCAY